MSSFTKKAIVESFLKLLKEKPVEKITIKDKNGRVRRANVCTRCMKAGKVERA